MKGYIRGLGTEKRETVVKEKESGPTIFEIKSKPEEASDSSEGIES